MPQGKPWRWIRIPDPLSDGKEGERHLLDPRGRNRATVWPNGVWHTWDTDGIGGENGAAVREDGEVRRPDMWIRADAMDQAVAAVVRQGWTCMKLVYELKSTEKKA